MIWKLQNNRYHIIFSIYIIQGFKMQNKQQSQKKLKEKFILSQNFFTQIAQAILSQVSKLKYSKIDSIHLVEENNDIKLILETTSPKGINVIADVSYSQSFDTFYISSFLFQNCKPVCITSHYSKVTAIKFLQKLNSSLASRQLKDKKVSGFNFCLNPITGMLYLNCKVFLHKSIKNQTLFSKQAQNGISSAVIQITNIFLEKQPLLNFIIFSKQLSTVPLSKMVNLAKQLKEIEKMRKILDDIIRFFDSNYELPQRQQDNQAIMKNYFLSNYLDFSHDLKKVFKFMNIEEEQLKNQIPLHKLLHSLSEYSCSFSQGEYQKAITRQIKITTDPQLIEWQVIGQGGFGLVQKAHVSFEIYDYEEKRIQINKGKGQIVKKTDFTQKKKIQNEKKILRMFKNDYHPNVMPHYICEQDNYKNCIFSKYQPELSLDKYLSANRKVMSLSTLISILNQIIHGLHFFKYKEVVHLDIKPQNIIITKNIKARITDFGQAYYLNSDAQKHRHQHAFTIPYAPPEVFNREVTFHQKNDIYSLGATIFKCLFDQHLFKGTQNREEYFRRVKQKKPNYIFSPELIEKFGMDDYLSKIILLSLKCLNFDPSQRPSIVYLSIMFELMEKYISLL